MEKFIFMTALLIISYLSNAQVINDDLNDLPIMGTLLNINKEGLITIIRNTRKNYK